MLEAHDITVRRGGRKILDGVSLALAPGNVTCVIGPNGSGKSTLLRVLSGVLAPDLGQVTLGGASLAHQRPQKLAAQRAVLSQDRPDGFGFSTREIVALGALRTMPRARAETDAIVARAIALVGLDEAADRRTDRLSGGERQRAHLARALVQLRTGLLPAQSGGILLLDEPLSAQDPRHQISILDIMRAQAASGGTVMVILHDINAAARVADRIVVLSQGRIAADGPPAAVITRAMLADVFAVDLSPRATPAAPAPFVLPQVARGFDASHTLH